VQRVAPVGQKNLEIAYIPAFCAARNATGNESDVLLASRNVKPYLTYDVTGIRFYCVSKSIAPLLRSII